MALDPEVFVDLALSYYQAEMESKFPEVVKGRSVSQETQEDGSTKYAVTDDVGPVEVDLEQVRPMFRAFGRAIVELLTGHAEIPDVVDTGATTKVGRIV